MPPTPAILDELSLVLALAQLANAQQSAETLADVLEDTIACPQLQARTVASIYELPCGSRTVVEALFPENPSPQLRDLLRRIQLAISRVSRDLNVPAAQTVVLRSNGVSISISSLATTAVMDLAQNGASFSTLIALTSVLPSGSVTLSRGTIDADCFVLSSDTQIPLAFRSQLIAIKGTQADCDDLFPYAFPRLYFHSDFSLFDLGIPESEALNTGLRHLSWLNDDFMNVFVESNRHLPEVVRRASIAISDESPLTKSNKRAMKEREIEVEGTTICCTLHSKLRPTIGRIHFHPPVKGCAAGKVIIGISAVHLLT